MSDHTNMCLCVRQLRHRTKIHKRGHHIRSDSSRNTIVQCTILSDASCNLQKQCFLALDVPLNATHEGPHGWTVTLEQCLQPVVPPLNAAGAASYMYEDCPPGEVSPG